MSSRGTGIVFSWIGVAALAAGLVFIISRGNQIRNVVETTKIIYFILAGLDDYIILSMMLAPISNFNANYYVVYPIAAALVFSFIAAILHSVSSESI